MNDGVMRPEPPSTATLIVAGLVVLGLVVAYWFYRRMPDPPNTGEEEPPHADYSSPFAEDSEAPLRHSGDGEG